MLLAVLLTGLICTLAWSNEFLQASAAEPGYLDFDNLPETNFSCENKVIGGYYADVETGCQMFHVCTIGQKGEVADIKFLCLNGTVFDQETRVCERLDEVDCSKSESYYDLNLELYGNSGATYGIQPENEEEPPATSDNDEDKCEDDEEDCKTEPQEPQEPQEPPPNKPAELEDEYEELEEIVDPTTPSTTSSTTTTTTLRPTRPPLTYSTSPRPPLTYSTSPRPPQIPYPTSSPETIAALLALHNAFQESLKEHERPPPPRVSSSFTSPSPLPAKTPPPPPSLRFSSPVSFSTSPRPLSFAHNSQNYAGGNHQPSVPQQPQVSNHHFPAPQTHRQPLPQPFPFNVSPKPKQPVPSFTSTIRTSQAFGNSNFQQTFREEQQQQQQQHQQQHQQQQHQQHHHQQQQQQKLLPQEEDEEYSVEDYDQTQASSPRPLYNAYKHNQNRFAISHQDTNPPPPPSNYLLHQLKLRFNDSPPQKHPGAHGFTRAVSNHDTKILSYPEKPPHSLIASSTTPAAVSVILSKSSTSSVVRSVSSRNQSAIVHVHPPPAFNASKYFTTSTEKTSSTTPANISQTLEEEYKAEEEYEDYLEEDLGPDPFYKDVQKLERQRRAVESQWNETDRVDIIRMKKEYVTLMKMLKNKKYQDPDKQIVMNDNLIQLKEKINLAEAHITPPSNMSSMTRTESTMEEKENNSLTMQPPPTPPIFHKPHTTTSHLHTTNPDLKHIKHYEFTLLANESRVLPLSSYAVTSSPAFVTVPPGKRITKVTINDLIDIPEDPVIHVSLRRKLVHEDYFGSLSSSKIESIRELLHTLKNKAPTRAKSTENGNDPKLWFSDGTDNIPLLGANFSEEMCTGENLYNDFVASSDAPDAINTSSPVLLLVGTRYVKLCRHIVSQRTFLVFLIETHFLLDTLQYRKLRQVSAQLRQEQLVDIIELKSRIKILQLQRKNTFKLLRDFSTEENPRFVVDRIVRRLEDSKPRNDTTRRAHEEPAEISA